jgi:hypothetical protein
MKSLRLIAVAASIAALAGCMHRGATGVSNGDVTIDSLSASRTAILRVQNNYGSDVRVYTVLKGQEPNYVAKALAGQTRAWVLDPQIFPNDAISFEARPADGSSPIRLGPYKVNKGETIELVVPANASMTRATIHRSTP